MSKEKKLPKEYAIKESLIIFFLVITIVGTYRLIKIFDRKEVQIDLEKINVIEQDTSINYSTYNIALANALEERFGIDIYYGDKLNLESVNAVNIQDEKEIFSMLIEVANTLSRYPDSLVREIEQKGYKVYIYLVSYFTTNMEALANRNSIGEFKIYMSNTINIERTLHHEFYHILDYYIKLENNEDILYKDWKMYNPEDFEYKADVKLIDGKYVYKGDSGAYFVSAYAKYSEKEDRAETFAEMVTANKSEAFFKRKEPIYSKMNIIKNALITSFKTITSKDSIVAI